MRIWDIDPGYLNRQSLLGEHRELHGIVSILASGKRGYANHPETLRWVGHGWALRQRHAILAAEMALRGYRDASPVRLRSGRGAWPEAYVDAPFRQFGILGEKYRERESGRIPLPVNAQQLWAQHKYSVMARDGALYSRLGREVAATGPRDDFSGLALTLVECLRRQPSDGGIRNALQHMWGYVSNGSAGVESWPLRRLLGEVRRCAMADDSSYLVSSTALGELEAWLPG
jgi:hypothetical protein